MAAFSDFLYAHFFFVKLMHLLAVFCWMAGLFYLPRIFVYHRESEDENVKATLDVMAYKLYRFIMVPAMHTSILFGMLLFLLPHNRVAGWAHAKIACILSLVVFQIYLNGCRKNLAARIPYQSGKFFRLINEIPTIALIIILILAIYKPF